MTSCCHVVTLTKSSEQHAFLLLQPWICFLLSGVFWICQVIFILSLSNPLDHPGNHIARTRLRYRLYAYPFFRATLCVSAVFAVARCLSVCPSVTLVDCIQAAEDIVILLSQPCGTMILVFWPRAPMPNFRESLQWGGRKIHGDWIFFFDFLLKSLSVTETVRDRPMFTTER